METEQSFSKSILKDDCLSLNIIANIFHVACLFFYLSCDCDKFSLANTIKVSGCTPLQSDGLLPKKQTTYRIKYFG